MDCGITNEIMDKMTAKEREFWIKFLSRAKKEIEATDDGTKEFTINPSKILERQYRKAIEKYDGKKYCQQLEFYFNF